MVASVVAILTVGASVATKLVGAPAQIRQLYRTGDARSFSLVHYTIIVTSYVLWTLHGLFQGDPAIVVGQGIGVLTSGTILALVIYFRAPRAQRADGRACPTCGREMTP